MEVLFGFGLVICLIWAIRRTTLAAVGFVKNRMADWETSHPDAGKAHHAGAMTGSLWALLRHGLPAMKDAWRAGWREGRAKAKVRYDGLPKPPPKDPDAEELPPPPDGDGAPPSPDPDAHDDERDTDTPLVREDGRPDLRPVPDLPPADLPPPNKPPGGTMTPEQIKAAAERMRQQAAAELQDAAAAKSRAQQAIKEIENLAASAAKVPYPAHDVAVIKAAMDPAQACARAADTRIQAAEAMAARANQIAAVAAKHANLVGQAAGTTYVRT
jgi:hypothetical protein